MRTTWDGLPISPDPPFGCAIVVFRRINDAGLSVLLLHRAHRGPDFDGDWAWTVPSGARLPGEAVADCARRELLEETGLALEPRKCACGGPDWRVYWAEAPADAGVVLDAEHDRFEWLAPETALARLRPDHVRRDLACVLDLLRLADSGLAMDG